MSKIATSLASKVNALVAEADGGAPVTESASASESSAAAPPSDGASGAESASDAPTDDASTEASTQPTLQPDSAAETRRAKHELIAEKTRALREKRQAARLVEDARRAREEAAQDRKIAQEEREKLNASLKAGTFKETIAALGRDPRAVFEEMKEEARIAGTPEAQLRVMQERFDKQVAAVVEPLKKTIEELTKERDAEREQAKTARERAVASAFASDFDRVMRQDEFQPLLVEYETDDLFKVANSFRLDPDRLFAHGKRLGLQIGNSDGTFTMLDIAKVLKAQQDQHDRAKASRRERLQATNPSTQAQQASSAKPTVNGTAERRNAGTTLGNDLASAKASGDKPRLTREQRVQKLIERG